MVWILIDLIFQYLVNLVKVINFKHWWPDHSQDEHYFICWHQIWLYERDKLCNILYKISLSIMAYWESFKKGYISIKTRWTSPRTWPTSKGMHWLSRSWPVSNHGPISQHPSFGGKESRFPGTSFTTPWDDLGNFLSWYCDVTWNSFYSNSLMSLEQASEV